MINNHNNSSYKDYNSIHTYISECTIIIKMIITIFSYCTVWLLLWRTEGEKTTFAEKHKQKQKKSAEETILHCCMLFLVYLTMCISLWVSAMSHTHTHPQKYRHTPKDKYVYFARHHDMVYREKERKSKNSEMSLVCNIMFINKYEHIYY